MGKIVRREIMDDLALDPKLKVVAEVANDLGRTERRIQQMIASGDLAARKATDLEELALRRAGRIRSSTERGVWLIQQEAVQRLMQLRTVASTETTRTKVGYPRYRPRSKQNNTSVVREAPWRALKHEPLWKVPITFTSLIGREQDVAMIRTLLLRSDVRLLTLLGVGGIGKTRLSLQVAGEMRPHFSDGICFVSLAAINDPAFVVPAIARELGIPETGTQPLFEQVQASLHDKHLLLILDNFEQVLSASVTIEELLAACLFLKIVVTSRAVLHLQAEQEFTVPPLALPNLNHLPEYEVLSDYAAVSLFVRRAQTILPAFQVTPENARPIAQICVRLDGLPLAIELAAARIKLLPPQALLARLTQRLQILTSGTRTVPERQQTLRNTLKWSYDLLTPEEQRLFRQLSIFVGGWSLEAVEAVVRADPEGSSDTISVLDGVASLLDKSLLLQVKQEGNEPRLIMLETVREYGLECVQERGETEVSQRAHALYYLRLAEQAEPHLTGAQQMVWMEQLDMEQENLRAALGWLLEHELDLALRLGVAMWWFWYVRGYWSEGRHVLEAALALSQTREHTVVRARALRGAGTLAVYQWDDEVGSVLLEESASLCRELGETRDLAGSLGELGWNKLRQNNIASARLLLEESIAIARELDDTRTLASSLHYLGWLLYIQSDLEGAFLLVKESVELCRERGDTHGLLHALSALSQIRVLQGNATQATALAQESLSLARDLHNKPDIADALYYLADAVEHQSEYEQAEALARELFALAWELGDKFSLSRALASLGTYALYRGDFSLASTFLEECLSLMRALGFKNNIAFVLFPLGELRRLQGDVAQATALHTEGVVLAREVGSTLFIGCHLVGLANVASAEGQSERAARLFGASALWVNPAVDFQARQREDYERAVESLRTQLGAEAFLAAWEQGLAMTPEQALAKQPHDSIAECTSSKLQATRPLFPDGLTKREGEVLRLVALGLSDTQVAEKLVISPRTVNGHLRSIYNKINVNSRSAATRYAMKHALIS